MTPILVLPSALPRLHTSFELTPRVLSLGLDQVLKNVKFVAGVEEALKVWEEFQKYQQSGAHKQAYSVRKQTPLSPLHSPTLVSLCCFDLNPRPEPKLDARFPSCSTAATRAAAEEGGVRPRPSRWATGRARRAEGATTGRARRPA